MDIPHRALAEANQRLRLFNASPTLLERRFNKSSPPYRSQSGTPVGGGPSEVSQDDPALLRKLREIARMIPLKWAENQYAGMSQKEKQEALEEWEEIRTCIEKDKEKREKRLDKFLYEGPTYGLFPDDDEAPESPPTVHTPRTRPTVGKRKREAGDPHREHSPTGSSPEPISRLTKRARTGNAEDRSIRPRRSTGQASIGEIRDRTGGRAQNSTAAQAIVGVSPKPSGLSGRPKRNNAKSLSAAKTKPSAKKIPKKNAAVDRLQGPASQGPVRRSERIAAIQARAVQSARQVAKARPGRKPNR